MKGRFLLENHDVALRGLPEGLPPLQRPRGDRDEAACGTHFIPVGRSFPEPQARARQFPSLHKYEDIHLDKASRHFAVDPVPRGSLRYTLTYQWTRPIPVKPGASPPRSRS